MNGLTASGSLRLTLFLCMSRRILNLVLVVASLNPVFWQCSINSMSLPFWRSEVGELLKKAGMLAVTRLLALVIVVSCSCMLIWLLMLLVVLLSVSCSIFSFIISHHTPIHFFVVF